MTTETNPVSSTAGQRQTVGLSAEEAERRLGIAGANELPAERIQSWPRALLSQLRDTVILVLLLAAGLTTAMGDLTDTIVILAVVTLNTVLSAGQEVRSSRALAALAELTAPRATVLRDGRECDVESHTVVPGDALLLRAGDIVAADGIVLAAESLQLDESMLTGESLPISIEPGQPVSAGTVVTRGHGTAEVTDTGSATALGRIGRGVSQARETLTPLQRQLAALGRWLAIAVSVVAVVVAGLNIASGSGVEYSITIAISLAVAAIPESLPAVVGLSLAMAARRMAAGGVLVRRLAAVEALGSVTVLACDKTGTLTEGRMSLVDVWTPDEEHATAQRLLELAALCNDAAPGSLEPERGVGSDPTEVALVEAAQEAGIGVDRLREDFPRTSEQPFDAALAQMTTHHSLPGGGTMSICKGSPEAVSALTGSAPAMAENAARFAGEGHRVLAVASTTDGANWALAGLVALADPPRPQAKAVMSAFHRAGVRTVMITGDHAATAQSIAHRVGLADPADPRGLTAAASSSADTEVNPTVFSRVRPEQKTDIVTALRARGDVVAMTGDGVNDAPALRAADVGVAMGKRGTEVAKQAAALVLTGDDLEAMVPAIAEGRRAYDNLRRFLHYALSGGLAEILIMLVGRVVGFPVPLQPGQILWVNLLTHGLPGVAMGNEAAEPHVLDRAPRPPNRPLVDRVLSVRVAVLGLVISACSLASALWAQHTGQPWQSSLFVTLTAAQLLVALTLRPSWKRRAPNVFLIAAVGINIALTVLAVRWSPLCTLLQTSTLGVTEIATSALIAAPAGVVAFCQRRLT